MYSRRLKISDNLQYKETTQTVSSLWYFAQGPVARSMVSVNQRLIPWQRIGFDTA